MITEDYVSFEIAKLLEEKGFNEYTVMVYNQNGSFMPNGAIEDTYQSFYFAPTLQMAMKWLREKHNLALSIDYSGAWSYSIHRTNVSSRGFFSEDFNTYEEACEDGIKCCLKTINIK